MVSDRERGPVEYAAATAVFAAAGIVVTEISSRHSAPDFAGSAEHPGGAREQADRHRIPVGGGDRARQPWSVSLKSRAQADLLGQHGEAQRDQEPSGKPTAGGEGADRQLRAALHCGDAEAGDRPESGPTTIAPTIMIALSRITPIDASRSR